RQRPVFPSIPFSAFALSALSPRLACPASLSFPKSPAMRTEFSDNTVAIRRFVRDDVLPLYEAARESLSDIVPRMRWCERDFSWADCEAWLKYTEAAWGKREAYNFAIVEPPGGRLLGTNWLSRIN